MPLSPGAPPSASEGKSLLRQDIRQDQSDTPLQLQQLDHAWRPGFSINQALRPWQKIEASSSGPQRKRRRTVDAFVEKLKEKHHLFGNGKELGRPNCRSAAEDGRIAWGYRCGVDHDPERKIKELTVNHLTVQSDPNIKANMRVLETLRVGEDNIKVYTYTFKNDPQKFLASVSTQQRSNECTPNW